MVSETQSEKNRIYHADVLDLQAAIRVAWQGRSTIVKITFVFGVASIILALLLTPLYRADLTVYPSLPASASSSLGQLTGIAANFGLDVGGLEANFHIPDIVESRRMGQSIISHKWNAIEFDEAVDLIDFWEISDTTGINLNPVVWLKGLFSKEKQGAAQVAEWTDQALERLVDRITVKEGKSGLIRISIWMEEPQLAADVANFIYDAIVEYTIEVHLAQAKLNREFIEERQRDVRTALTRVEDKLKDFRIQNRKISDSPTLQTMQERLLREVEIQQQVYITLQQQYELARIEEVKETPSVVILDEGIAPTEKDRPKRRKLVVMITFLGGVMGTGWVVGKQIKKDMDFVNNTA